MELLLQRMQYSLSFDFVKCTNELTYVRLLSVLLIVTHHFPGQTEITDLYNVVIWLK